MKTFTKEQIAGRIYDAELVAAYNLALGWL